MVRSMTLQGSCQCCLPSKAILQGGYIQVLQTRATGMLPELIQSAANCRHVLPEVCQQTLTAYARLHARQGVLHVDEAQIAFTLLRHSKTCPSAGWSVYLRLYMCILSQCCRDSRGATKPELSPTIQSDASACSNFFNVPTKLADDLVVDC